MRPAPDGAPHGRPPLALVRDDAPPPPAVAARAVFVIQNHGLSDSVRLVVLGGDPEARSGQRPGIAVLELFPGEWSLEEQRELVELLEAKAAEKWEAKRRQAAWLEEFVRREREQFEARRERARRGWRTRRGGGAA